MGISFRSSGSTSNMESFLHSMERMDIRKVVEPYAQEGVAALRAATPVESGLAASSWGYEITGDRDTVTITWTNTDIENGFPVVVMLQHGYGTGTGGYVQGRDFINPAVKPIFDKISEGVWRVVTSA